MTEHIFTLEVYQNIVRSFLDQNYTIESFKTAIPSEKHLILRHDVDMSLQYAADMAAAEQDIGAQSTYFVLIRTGLYNLFSAENESYLHDILSRGHNIGLHFDASLYDQDAHSLERAVEKECDILEAYLNCDIETVSFHRPAKFLYGYEPLLAGRQHAYQPYFFSDMDYCSDSKGGWHHGHPLDRELKGATQLLTHPIWWVFEGEIGAQEKLELYVEAAHNSFKETLRDNCVSYKKD